MISDIINKCLQRLEKAFLLEMKEHAVIKQFSAKSFIIRQGQFIRFLPIVLSGNVKVFSDEDTVQFLLYYIESGEPCIFSFAHLLNDEPIEFSAFAESDSELLMLPITQVRVWMNKYPSFVNLLLMSYKKHYQDLLNTTKQIIGFNLEDRLFQYLKTKVKIGESAVLKISHLEIANDLGTSREVISRLLKKMSVDQKVVQIGRTIKVL